MHFILEQFLCNAVLTLHQYLKPQRYQRLIQGDSIQAVGQTVTEKMKKPLAREHPQAYLQQLLKEVKNAVMQVTVCTILLMRLYSWEDRCLKKERSTRHLYPFVSYTLGWCRIFYFPKHKD